MRAVKRNGWVIQHPDNPELFLKGKGKSAEWGTFDRARIYPMRSYAVSSRKYSERLLAAKGVIRRVSIVLWEVE